VRVSLAAIVLLISVAPAPAFAQAAGAQPPSQQQSSTITTTREAAEADGDTPARSVIAFNNYGWRGFTFRWGGGLLYDYATYSQDANSQSQMSLSSVADLRDFRVLLKGKTPIPHVTYTLGYMYDKAKGEWRFRQTGIMVDIPRAYGDVFIGRTKEGFSTSKIMVGYQGWTNERATINDALIPILADGVKWTGRVPNGKLVYTAGFYGDALSEGESFNKHDNQAVFRGVWEPLYGSDKRVLHIAFETRYALSNNGSLQYRSKPESYQAQSYAIDTGKFSADSTNTYGVETYYRPGPTMFGMEYFFNAVNAPDSGNPMFHGGELLFARILTGETRPYNARGAYFERVSPRRSVFNGGPGAWELIARFSYSDMDSKTIQGGRFWRLTPMVNWHMSDNVRLEFVYGYGTLDRFGVVGRTQFFQSRIQFQL